MFVGKKKMKTALPAIKRDLQRLLDRAAFADLREGIRQGLEDARIGRGRPAREFFKEFEKKYRLSGEL